MKEKFTAVTPPTFSPQLNGLSLPSSHGGMDLVPEASFTYSRSYTLLQAGSGRHLTAFTCHQHI